MPIITAIKPQKNRKRVNIYLDGRFGFGLDLENFLKLGLKVEQELTNKQIEEIVKKAEFQKIYDKLLKFATLRSRSEKEIKDWFGKHKVHTSLQKELFNRLKRLELVDDKKFAQWWVDQRISFRPRGKRALFAELRQKGIKREIINDVLAKTKINEQKIARKLLEKRSYRWEKLGKLEKRKKAGEFLARKGFDWGTIKTVVDDFLKD